jgi:hypothetical protein
MPKLRTLGPLVRSADTRTARPPLKPPPPKWKNPIYDSPEFRAWRAKVVARAGAQCEAMDDYGNRCPKAQPHHRMYADHIIELKDGGALLDLNNGQCLCSSHHELKSAVVRAQRRKR